MFVALDATYLVDPHPSGIAVYSRELLDGLARTHPTDRFLHLYRLKQYRRLKQLRNSAAQLPMNVQNRLLLPFIPPLFGAQRPQIFHALNQRVDRPTAKHVVSTFHDLFVMTGEYSSAEFRKRFTRQAREAAKRSDLLIAVSAFTKQQLIAYLNIEADRIRVIPHGVHLPDRVVPADQRERMILCVGALQIRKNVLCLLEAFERLPPALRNDWKLVLAGSTAGFGAAEIVARIDRSPVLHQVQLRGYVSAAELKDLYRRAAIFAFPSLDEGFGIPVLEAMAHGVPVLTSNRSALPEVAGNAAILVDPYDSEAIEAGLVALIKDDSLRSRLIAAGLERARDFSWQAAVTQTYKVYSEVV